jgi:3-keto steroid reductase
MGPLLTTLPSGVGFGIWQRLLLQVTSKFPTDAQLHYDFHVKQSIDDEVSFSGLTLIPARRSRRRREAARDRLYWLVDERVRQLETLPGHDGHAGNCRKHLTIAVHTVDLAHIQSVFRFADEAERGIQRRPHAND